MQTTQNLVLGIASTGRREQLTRTMQQLLKLHRRPDRVVIAVPSRTDVDEEAVRSIGFDIKVIVTSKGLCVQRNAIIDDALDSDLLAFIDDDYYPNPDYFTHVQAVFEQHPSVVLATGHPRLDGACGPGISHEVAVAECERFALPASTNYELIDTYGGYGCNMVYRTRVFRDHGVRFDECLPLYGWLEDMELSRRVATASWPAAAAARSLWFT